MYLASGLQILITGKAGLQIRLDGGKNMWWGNDVKYGRTQWSFFNTEKPYETIKWDIKNVGSLNDNDCVPTSFAEANEYFGGDTSYEEYKTSTGYVEGLGVEKDHEGYSKLLSEHFEKSSYNNQDLLKDPQNMRDILNRNAVIHTNMPHTGMRHADNLRSISYYHSGKVVLKYRIGSFKLSSVSNDWWFYILKGLK